jgi:hypothetical protein
METIVLDKKYFQSKRTRKINGYWFPEQIPVSDDMAPALLVPTEFVNQGDEEIVWINEIVELNPYAARYLMLKEGVIGEKVVITKPGGTSVLFHQFYSAGNKSGGELKGLFRYGNKIQSRDYSPSAPEDWSKSF